MSRLFSGEQQPNKVQGDEAKQLNKMGEEERRRVWLEAIKGTSVETFIGVLDSLKGEKIEEMAWSDGLDSTDSTLTLKTEAGRVLSITITDWYNAGEVKFTFRAADKEGHEEQGRFRDPVLYKQEE